jgi:hypothetical protein
VIERLALSLRWTLDRPVVFVLGLPRSGTSLVYQYIVHRLEVAHWTTGVADHPQAPVVTTFLEKRRRPNRSDFRSQYAGVEGGTALREPGLLWSRFFDVELPTPSEGVRPDDARRLRNLVAATQRLFGGAPFVDNDVKHILRIDALAKIFPESLFLCVRRRIHDTALSILRARIATPDPTQWWSVRPPNWEGLRALPLEEQVAAQVLGLRRQLGADLAAVPNGRVLQLDYEHFCREPDATLGPLRRMLGALGERNGPEGCFAAVHHVPGDERERRLVALLGDRNVRMAPPEPGRSGGA